jgi:RNA polymerase sigma-70 factor (ECF subfamily)
MEWTDNEAAREALAGNQQAFGLLVDRHSRAIFRLAFRITANEQDAEDIVQETFLRAFKQLPKFESQCAFGTWLYRICTNCALDHIRARKTRREQGPATLNGCGRNGDESMLHWLDRVAAPEPSPERLTQSSQIAKFLEPAMASLSETERAAFILRHYEGCDIDEIAAALGVRAGAAKHSVFRAVQKLRRAMQPIWQVEAK